MTRPESQPRHPLALLAERNEKKRELMAAAQVGSGVGFTGVCELRRELHALDQVLDAFDPAALRAQAEAGQVLVNRQALTMILSCLQEGADDPRWEQVYPTGYLFSAVNELTLNLEGQSDPIERQALAEIAEEARAALAQAGGE